ncbi:MAG TPA: type VI secretion system baseplate subunit TssK [Gammaproteobacteria bacterium]|nr:type VI secretion system baseplate subunit TssK [Gammaproteobacteria bacterium]
MKKVVWAEGVLLGQQHLQQFDDYHHARQDFLAKLASPYPWGIKKLMWDEENLSYGKLIIKYCEIIFPHGLIIQYDSRVNLPLSTEFTAAHENRESVYLAVPLSDHIKDITGYPSQSGLSGWKGEYQTVLDEQDLEREREVLFAHPNLCLLTSKEDKNLFYALKIADVVKKNIGEYALEKSFIPSCLFLSASDVLMDLLSTHSELISSKASLLQSRRKQSRTEWQDFVLLQLFNTALSEINILKSCSQLHPLEFYKVLIRLIGALNPENPLPSYDHNNLTKIFYELDSLLKQGVDHAIPSRMSCLTWVRETEFLYTAEHLDSHVFKKNSFYVAVTMNVPVMEWLSLFTAQIKIGARSVIESIVASALTGVKLIHIQRPPDRLPIKAGYEYFYIEPNGHFWEQIKTEQTLSIFVSHIFSAAQIELLTVEEGE